MSRLSGSEQWARRLPPLAMGGLALALMVAILPSSLHLPSTGPNAQAEVAPVPGAGQNQSNLSQLGLAESGTVGGGGSSAVGDANPPPDVLNGLVPNRSLAQQSQCVGSPPRQTEDPLSPPCVSSWSGDNGGSTMNGVSGSSILVVLYDGESGGDGRDLSQPIQSTDNPYQRTAKTLVRYFQSRFITYGRSVRVLQIKETDSTPDAQVADAKKIIQKKPFAVIPAATSGDVDYQPFLGTIANAGIEVFAPITTTGSQDIAQSFLQSHSPLVWSFNPDLEAGEAGTAAFVCRELKDLPASRAGGTMAMVRRKFGLVYETKGYSPSAAGALDGALQQACGIHADVVSTDGTNSGGQAAAAKMDADANTSVLCICTNVNVPTGAHALVPPYQPEWIVNPDGRYQFQNFGRQMPPDEWNGAFGVTWLWRAPAMPQTYWYQAYASLNSDGQFDSLNGWSLYEGLLQLFTAIQRGGARLNAQSIQTGLEGLTRPSPGPTSPPAAFGPGRHSFLQALVQETWDPTGSTPGGADPESEGSGCYRLIGGGGGRRADEWPAGDHTGDAGSCGADFTTHANSNADANGTQGPGS